MSDLDNFHRWFCDPLAKLKEVPDGGAGFIVMSIGCMLCERWHRIETGEQDNWRGEKFKDAAAAYLNINKDFFADFWDVYRNGIQHQGQPKWRKGDGKDRKPYRWLFHDSFSDRPTLGTDQTGLEYICINPFKFTDLYIGLFLSDPQKLSQADLHSLGEIGNTTLQTIEEVRP